MAKMVPEVNVGVQPAEATVVASLVADAARARSEIKILRTSERGAPFAVLDDCGRQRVEALGVYEGPRKRASVGFVEQQGFVDYINLYADQSSRIFCDMDKAGFVAVLDYHETNTGDDVGRRGEHRATLQLRYTEEFGQWKALTGMAIKQAALAEFLEDHYNDIAEPDGAAILELVRALEVKNDVAFKSSQRRNDGGYDLTYSETVTARAGQQGTIEVPSKLLLQVQVFQGGRVMDLPVRVRFKLDGGTVFFALAFLGLEKLLRDEVAAVRVAIAEAIKRPVWAGGVAL
jgi:uncharacterized protein YfdQ (DUF2303 family)